MQEQTATMQLLIIVAFGAFHCHLGYFVHVHNGGMELYMICAIHLALTVGFFLFRLVLSQMGDQSRASEVGEMGFVVYTVAMSIPYLSDPVRVRPTV